MRSSISELLDVLFEVRSEYFRARDLHPYSIHLPDGTGIAPKSTETLLKNARHACEIATKEGTLTHAHVLEEEFWEAMAETEPAKLRAELIQVAAVCLKWVLDIDSRNR